MTLDPNAPEVTTLQNNDLLEVYSGRSLKRISAANLAISINNNIDGVVMPFVTAKQFGAMGDDLTDDTVALQTAINFAIANNIALVLNPGNYRITAPLEIIPNKNSFRIIGQGVNSAIKTNQSMDCMLRINRVANGLFSGLYLTTFGTPIVDKMIHYYWDGTVNTRSSTRNMFEDILITGRFKTGFKIGLDNTAVQCDNTIYENVTVTGTYTFGDTDIWQVGIEVGDGLHGNNLLHSFWQSVVVGCKRGVYVNRCGHVLMDTVSFSVNEIDLDIQTSRAFSGNNLRSEGSGMFLSGWVNGAAFGQLINIKNSAFSTPEEFSALWKAFNPNNYVMDLSQGGSFLFENFSIGAIPTGVLPKIKMSAAQRKNYLSMNGYRLSLDVSLTDPADLFVVDTKSSIDAKHIARATVVGQLQDNETFYSYEVINGVEQ